ncbi:30190_t:CDS:2, partial [Racocetra persica]
MSTTWGNVESWPVDQTLSSRGPAYNTNPSNMESFSSENSWGPKPVNVSSSTWGNVPQTQSQNSWGANVASSFSKEPSNQTKQASPENNWGSKNSPKTWSASVNKTDDDDTWDPSYNNIKTSPKVPRVRREKAASRDRNSSVIMCNKE